MSVESKLNLGIVQETLLLPLAARVAESKRSHGAVNDPKSIEVAQKINFNYRKVAKDITPLGVVSLAYRARRFDELIRDFLEQHPKGIVLTLGAGLDTSYYRCDNGQAKWFDLDLEDSLALREQLLPPPNDRVQYLRKSLFDISWIDDIGDIQNGLFIQVAGVLPYLEEEDVKNLITILSKKLSGATMIFDAVSSFGALMVGNLIYAAGMKEAHLKWKVLNARDLEKWSEHIQADSEPFFKYLPKKNRGGFINDQIMMVNDFLRIAQIIQLKFV